MAVNYCLRCVGLIPCKTVRILMSTVTVTGVTDVSAVSLQIHTRNAHGDYIL